MIGIILTLKLNGSISGSGWCRYYYRVGSAGLAMAGSGGCTLMFRLGGEISSLGGARTGFGVVVVLVRYSTQILSFDSHFTGVTVCLSTLL